MARKKAKKIYKYACSLTEKVYRVTKEASNPDELLSVAAYYELHPEKDDRPEHIKKMLTSQAEEIDELQSDSSDDSSN